MLLNYVRCAEVRRRPLGDRPPLRDDLPGTTGLPSPIRKGIMRLRTIAAATAAAAALAMCAAGTSAAATLHAIPALQASAGVGHVMFHAPAPILHSGIKGMHTNAASCGMENIGAPGNYGYAGQYAGQVEQMLDTCPVNGVTDTVWAHFQWAGSFQTGQYAGASLGLAVGSPYDYTAWQDNIATTAIKDVYFGGANHSDPNPNPDAWRAGAEINNDGCDQWGTLHWYGGADWDGPQGGCFGHDQLTPAIGQG
jgi:hypothetical protein